MRAGQKDREQRRSLKPHRLPSLAGAGGETGERQTGRLCNRKVRQRGANLPTKRRDFLFWKMFRNYPKYGQSLIEKGILHFLIGHRGRKGKDVRVGAQRVRDASNQDKKKSHSEQNGYKRQTNKARKEKPDERDSESLLTLQRYYSVNPISPRRFCFSYTPTAPEGASLEAQISAFSSSPRSWAPACCCCPRGLTRQTGHPAAGPP